MLNFAVLVEICYLKINIHIEVVNGILTCLWSIT